MNLATPFFPVPGVRLGVARAGIKYPDRRDLVVLEAAVGSTCAAVFTRNAFCAAPVTVAKQHLAATMPRYLLINTGNANAGTGAQGLDDALASCRAVAELGHCHPDEVLPFSTGVIGEPLPLERLRTGLPAAFAALDESGWEDASWGILTTDTRPKLISRRFVCAGQTLTLTGIAKGAGMIRPDMATMLGFLATDAAIEQSVLQHCLQQAVAVSFNAITVDGDTSTNDACVLLATGRSGVSVDKGEDIASFTHVLQEICVELAQALVRDSEGASKFITVQVEQGRNTEECRQLAYTVAHSPLVKTAFFASDPNWGRILAAVGRSGLSDLVLEDILIWLDEVCIVQQGGRAPAYSEEQGQTVMQRTDITIRIELGRGQAEAIVWTSDLSDEYVRINAEYRS